VTATANLNGSTLTARVSARRDAEHARRSRALFWRDLLSSLWAPVTVFGLALLPYIVLIEFSQDSAAWAQPALKLFGLLMMGWFFALLVLRRVYPVAERQRRLRREARELLGEVDRRLRRKGGALKEESLRRLEDQATRLDAALAGGESAVMEQELRSMSDLAEKDLPGFRRGSTSDFVSGFGKALLIALAIRTVLIEPYRIPSGSMLPTLQIGDQVFINKYLYGVRIPFLNLVPFVFVRPPARGDVIVFENPKTGQDYIKRVIGVPGDRVELREGVTYINGELVPHELLSRSFEVMNRDQLSGEWSAQEALAFEERLGNERFVSLKDPGELRCRQEGPYVVPEGNVFVMGDNRDNSSDSRYGLGTAPVMCDPRFAAYVPFGNIKGKAMVIWLSLGRGGLFDGPWGFGLRTDRLFLPVR
jgi:signal peptidase I